MGDSREAGVFMGHTEGVTYVDSKGDGRYVLSNGKDQLMKLWDLRKMMPTEKASELNPGHFTTGFDYRFGPYSEQDYEPHPYDCSLVTFRGHSVLKTLIRCHFSPPGSTDSRYVYSGSEDGSVYIYNLDATLKKKVDVNGATHGSRPRGDADSWTASYAMDDRRTRDSWTTCVRDASWHPNAPVIAGKIPNVTPLKWRCSDFANVDQLHLGTDMECRRVHALYTAGTTGLRTTRVNQKWVPGSTNSFLMMRICMMIQIQGVEGARAVIPDHG